MTPCWPAGATRRRLIYLARPARARPSSPGRWPASATSPFFATPERFEAPTPPPAAPVIIDNVDVDPYPLRRLLAGLQLRAIRTALLISRHANPGLLPLVTLPPPGPDDIIVVLHNLSQLDYYALNPPESANLWLTIRATL